ncbi:MAG TPA: twin-arginine translocase subunit TatC, partial [Bacteroidales bacterium]|nr:twin-arginine translocase subunit TatC [Bacteroidales bacterium]
MNKPKDISGVMTFWKHLEELRSHLVRSALAVGVFGLVVFLNKEFVFSQVILAPKEPFFLTNRVFCNLAERFSIPALCINASPLQVINIDIAGQFTTHILISVVAGIILAIPYIIWEIWRFIKPGLTPKEQANSRGAVLVISALFLTGVLFAYFFIVPLSINFLGTYQVSSLVENQVALRSYISLITTLSLATGIVFELPVFVYFLSRVGILTPAAMRKHRKIAIILILVISAVITPPDVISQILVG